MFTFILINSLMYSMIYLLYMLVLMSKYLILTNNKKYNLVEYLNDTSTNKRDYVLYNIKID